MIASLQGEIIGVGEDFLIIRVGGIGLKVFVPTGLRGPNRTGEQIFLHTHLVVREDALTLYGFETVPEQEFFNLLLGVNGIGPRTALAILGALPVETIRRAVLTEQADLFARVPGVGKKTAQKILLYLQGKVSGTLESLGLPVSDVDTEVMDALTALGYSVVEAQSALQSIPRDTPKDVETRLRLALRYFST
ncbi:MAG TPA: Holliday junction branch migration protein RuvA [Anaerolineaceae bacterium]|nr:Holliday junction branch migration protein RuvA [Anaerolineaceae bacterium]